MKASVTNAQAFRRIQQEYGSFDAYTWGFTDGKTLVEDYALRTTSPLSDQIYKDLKRRGIKFVGSTVIYSYLQAMSAIDGHMEEGDCAKTIKGNNMTGTDNAYNDNIYLPHPTSSKYFRMSMEARAASSTLSPRSLDTVE